MSYSIENLVCGPTKNRCTQDMNWVERVCTIGWDVTEGGCWNWRGDCTRGRARLSSGHGSASPYRVLYEAIHGPIPSDLVACHLCDNARCVNPGHIQPGTQKENMSTVSHSRRNSERSRQRIKNLYDEAWIRSVAAKYGKVL